MNAKVVAVNVSLSKGTKKRPVPQALLVVDHGIDGDAHAGPWHRQLSLLGRESIAKIQRTLPSVSWGDFAENITTEGIVLHTLPVGSRLAVGATLLEITQIGKECHQHCEIFQTVGDCVMPREGVFARVLAGGQIRAGDEVSLVCEKV